MATECGLATNYHDVTHPSLPNYIAATSGLSYSAPHGNYTVRHHPAVYCTTLHGCSGSDVAYSLLASDLAHNQLPAFSFITPNLIDDMNNGTVADGNKWLSSALPAILNSAGYRHGSTVIFITWDEGEGGGTPAESTARPTPQTSAAASRPWLSARAPRRAPGPARCSTTTPCWPPRSSSCICPS